jgi:circadian clock protein KaiC
LFRLGRAAGGIWMSSSGTNPSADIASTGITGLDDVLSGGFARRRLFLVEGTPGAGKTTLALQYLRAGAAAGEPVMYVTLSETEEELRAVADSHGWRLEGIDIHEVSSWEASLDPDDQNTMFHPSEVELAATIRPILTKIEAARPTRVVFDSLSELRLLAGNPLRYRRQILALKQFLATRNCTVLLLDDLSANERDMQTESLAHGVVVLEQLQSDYGSDRRRLRVMKYRGTDFRGGYHDYVIRTGGLVVFPRLIAAEHRHATVGARLPSDLTALDTLLGGGIEEGTSTLIVGAAGTGKSTLAAQFVAAAAQRGQKSSFFLFDESPTTLLTRCGSLNIDLDAPRASGLVEIRQVDPAELTPGEFIHAIRSAVDDGGVKIIVIDSLNGYLNAMPEERHLTIQLHELLMFLGQRSVATIMIGAHHGLIGAHMAMPVDASYLADAVILLRYYETGGELRQAISVVKKRGSCHERTLRDFSLSDGIINVGGVLRELRGVLTGVPTPLEVDSWQPSLKAE